jgi:hypothetical protein
MTGISPPREILDYPHLSVSVTVAADEARRQCGKGWW